MYFLKTKYMKIQLELRYSILEKYIYIHNMNKCYWKIYVFLVMCILVEIRLLTDF